MLGQAAEWVRGGLEYPARGRVARHSRAEKYGGVTWEGTVIRGPDEPVTSRLTIVEGGGTGATRAARCSCCSRRRKKDLPTDRTSERSIY